MFKKISKIYLLLTKKNKNYLFFVILLSFLSSLFDLIGIISVLPFLSLLVDPSLLYTNFYLEKINSYLNYDNDQFLIFLGMVSFVIIFLNQLVRFASKMVSITFARGLICEITGELFNFYLKQPYNFFSSQNKNLLIQKCTLYVEHLISGTLSPYIHIFSQILTTTIILGFLIVYQSSITIILSLFLLSYYFLFYKQVSRKYNSISKNYSEYFERFSQSLGDAFGVIQQLKLFKNNYFKNNFSYAANLYKKANITQNFYGFLPSHFIEVFAYGSILIVSLVLFFQSTDLKNIIPVLGVITISLRRIIPSFQDIYQQILQIRFHEGVFDKIYPDLKKIRYLQSQKENKKTKKNIDKNIKFEKNLTVKNLSYNYKNSKNIINISVNIKKGQFIGVCGKTGIGKSTFINILSGLLKKKDGEIKLDGQSTEIFENHYWKNKIGYATQNRYIINDTIVNNISLGENKYKSNLKTIKKLCKIVDLETHIAKLKSKYNTKIGDSGLRLSGGQEQKLIIARALYNNPEILIFDEATNALDSISEVKILKNIKRNFKKLTLIFVTHRLNSLKKCDKIIYLENSRVKSFAEFNKLKKNVPNFNKLIIANNY